MKFPPRGFEFGEEAPLISDNVIIAAGSGYGVLAVGLVVSVQIPPFVKLYIREFSARIVGAGSDQVYFSIFRNGNALDSALHRINGVAFDSNPRFNVELVTDPGLIAIVAFNKSGTTEPGAGPAAPVTVQAQLQMNWLRQIQQGRVPSLYSQAKDLLGGR